ncbi:MAG: hypothetical protein B6242_03085 [Anaerolineaceae bacterium 4572_78]|nr:MAG: hypothetical protein B6242_03085 [Anaerolineaceae bacterium 4572_78]
MLERFLSFIIYGLSTAIGIIAFIYPFWQPALQQSQTHRNDSPLLLTVLVTLCFVVILFEVQGQGINTKLIALLGILVSINSILRFMEVAIPIPGGFSPIFFLIILTGYVYGGRFGFLMGALTLIVSALITGGVGPWLPYQMLTAGWVGLTASSCRIVVKPFKKGGSQTEIIVLAIFGGLWGFIYGIIINMWFWSFATGIGEHDLQANIGFIDTLRRYALFYVATSLLWDFVRGIGNTFFILFFGKATLSVLRRFQQRFDFSYISQS